MDRYLVVLSQNWSNENGQNLGGDLSLIDDLRDILLDDLSCLATFRAIIKLSWIRADSGVVFRLME